MSHSLAAIEVSGDVHLHLASAEKTVTQLPRKRTFCKPGSARVAR